MNKHASDMSQPKVDALMRHVGVRVRAVRNELGFTRKDLSEASGVSPRYLAQLESGAGNISIGLLQRIALALGHPIETLIAPDDPVDASQVSTFYRKADTATQSRVMQILDPGRLDAEKHRRVCLIGLRGAGKSTLGEALAADLNAPFVELNREIEQVAGVPVPELIALYGDEGCRRFEADAT